MADLEQEAGASRGLWMSAAALALVLHLGGAALALANLRPESDEGLGAAGAEFAVEMASPDAPDSDLPPGEESAASTASPQLSEQKTEVKEADLPKDQPEDTEEPDRVVTQNDSKKPEEDNPKVAAIQTEASDAAPEAVEAAPQKLEDAPRQAEKPKSPSVGIGRDARKLTADWGRKISAYFQQHLRYPKDRTRKATATVNIVLNRKGNVVSAEIAESSGDNAFDEAALAMVHRSDPVPPPPASLNQDVFSFRLPVNFRANGRT